MPIVYAMVLIVIDDMCFPFHFRVLSESYHDIILGCDFLINNEAVTDYVNGELYLW